jgi:hypothetical protein
MPLPPDLGCAPLLGRILAQFSQYGSDVSWTWSQKVHSHDDDDDDGFEELDGGGG